MHSSQYDKFMGKGHCVTILPPQTVKQFSKSYYVKQGERGVLHSLFFKTWKMGEKIFIFKLKKNSKL